MRGPLVELGAQYRHQATLAAMKKILDTTEKVILADDFRSATGMNTDEQGDAAAAVAQHIILVGHEIDRRIDLHLKGWRPDAST